MAELYEIEVCVTHKPNSMDCGALPTCEMVDGFLIPRGIIVKTLEDWWNDQRYDQETTLLMLVTGPLRDRATV